MTVPHLSLTEERIVLLLAAGRSKVEIAADIGVDERTVEWHLARAARKLEQASALHRHVSEWRGVDEEENKPERLTERERQIASRAAAGRSNKQIGEELGIGARTVEWNLTRVYRKLGVRSRAELEAAVANTPWAVRPIAKRAVRPRGEKRNSLRPTLEDAGAMMRRLTEREEHIARRAAKGMPSKAIAEEVGLAVRTVEWHLSRVYRKLGIGSRAELVTWAAQLEKEAERPIDPVADAGHPVHPGEGAKHRGSGE